MADVVAGILPERNTVANFRFYGFNLILQLITVILLTDIMLYQPIEVLKSVL